MKVYQWFCLLLFPLFLTGCFNYTELNELGIVESMAMDKEETEYRVWINLIDAKLENDDSDELRKTYDATGSTITEAIQNLYLKSNKKIYLSHIETLLLSEDIAKEDITFLMDFFLRNKESRNSFTTLIVKNTNVGEILSDTKRSPELNDILQINMEEYGITSLITFEDFSRMLLEEGIDALLPVIKLDHDQLEVDGYAYFKANKFSGYLSKEEALTYNILKNKNSHIVLSYSCDKNKTNVKLEQLNTLSKSKNNQIQLKITGNLTITENQCNLKQSEVLEVFENKIKTEINHLLTKQEMDAFDILGMQSLVRQNNYLYYQKEKENLLEKLSYQIKVNLIYRKEGQKERRNVDESK